MKKVTIKDVAKLAKVSVATVSRTINNADYPISEKKRKAVEDAVRALNYVPSSSAQNLKYNKSRLIGLIVRDIADPYFAEIAKGVTETAANLGYQALVCNSKRDINFELQYYDTLRQHNVAGIIVAGGGYLDKSIMKSLKERIERSKSLGIESIALAPQGFDMPSVSVDNISVGRKIGQYLVDNNHSKIAFIGGDARIIVNEERLSGFIEAIKKSNIEIDHNLIVNDEFTWEGGYRSVQKIMNFSRDITAICCANDNIAIGVMRYLKEIGLKIPEDISLISVGDIVLSEYTSPKLTTARIPLFEMGVRCVELICSGEGIENTKTIFDVDIIERESVKMLR